MKFLSSNLAREALNAYQVVVFASRFSLLHFTLRTLTRFHHWNFNFFFIFHWFYTFWNLASLYCWRPVVNLSLFNRTQRLVLSLKFFIFGSIIGEIGVVGKAWFFRLKIFLKFWVGLKGLRRCIVFEIVGLNGREPVQKPDKDFKRIIGVKNPKV
jgi:hypothetical protein